MLNGYYAQLLNSNKNQLESKSAVPYDTRIVLRGIKSEPEAYVEIKQEPIRANVPTQANFYGRPKVEFSHNRTYPMERSFMRRSVDPATSTNPMASTRRQPIVKIHGSQQLMITGRRPPPGKIVKVNRQLTSAYTSWPESSFECDICQNCFDSLQLLLDHKRLHTTEWSDISDLEGLQQWKNKRMNALASAKTLNSTFVVSDYKSFNNKFRN